jgi:death-on-curing protein
MTAWRWVEASVVFAVHDRQIAEHGGLPGIRDLGAIESALARPRNLMAYGAPDVAGLAAAYAFGLARNRGFADGNKRTAWVVARLFLLDNGATMRIDRADAVITMMRLAEGALEEGSLAEWFRRGLDV